MIVNGKHVQSVIHNGNSISKLIRNGVELYREIKPIARYSAKGRTNQDTDRETLWDLTGNGHDIRLNNFGFIDGSGYMNDGLYFDGIDDYGFVDDFTCEDDYTIIINREWFNITGDRVLLSKRGIPTDLYYGEFEVEKRHNSYSYGIKSRVNIEPPIIMNKRETIYQTKTSYNGTIPIIPGSEIPTSQLILGAGIRTANGQVLEFFNGAVYDLLIYDKTLSSAEIEKEILKYNL